MVAELKKVLKQVENLPRKRQRELATLILDEIKWDKTFGDTQGELEQLAAEAVGEYKARKTKPLKIG
ncbi:MAG: hypothetical protein L6Q51_02365 [Cyclobacteriaceae bacterium]|nr:hypothetical protein [Cyclobacteriaceae bacterium]QOI97144.1 MAG: hypothetical protein HRU69_06405 [Flammeovirgaceae bacterium]